MSSLEYDLATLRGWVAARTDAIDHSNTQAEWWADQNIVRVLHGANFACPPNARSARQGFRSAARAYSQTRSRQHRDALVKVITQRVLVHHTVAAILAGAGKLTIAAFAAPSCMFIGGQAVYGYSVDNGDGTHQFIYDNNSNGVLDSEVMVNNQTGMVVSPEPDSLGLLDVAQNVFHLFFF